MGSVQVRAQAAGGTLHLLFPVSRPLWFRCSLLPTRLPWCTQRCTLRAPCLEQLPKETQRDGKSCFLAWRLPAGGFTSRVVVRCERLSITGLQERHRKEKALLLGIKYCHSRNSKFYLLLKFPGYDKEVRRVGYSPFLLLFLFLGHHL